jgi:hypothetical protein
MVDVTDINVGDIYMQLRINTNKYEYLYQITYNKKPPPFDGGSESRTEKEYQKEF